MRDLDLTSVSLPPAAAEKLAALRQAADESLALSRSTMDKTNQLREQAEVWESKLRDLQEPQVRAEQGFDEITRVYGPHISVRAPVDPANPQFVEAMRESQRLWDQIERVQERHKQHQARWESLSGLVSNLEKYLLKVAETGIAAFDGSVDATLRKNESLSDAIERLRRRLRELKADARRVAVAPRPSDFTRTQILEWVKQLSERGRPDALGLVETGRIDTISWPETTISTSVHGVAQLPSGQRAPAVSALALRIPDMLALLAWVLPKQLSQRLQEEAQSLSDDENALSDEQRAQHLKQIDDDALAIEREEESLIMKGEAESVTIQRRSNADPRAVLMLSGNLPCPPTKE